MIRSLIYIFIFSIFSFGFSQEKESIDNEVNQDELGNVTDDFQENFFQAITQRAILNHERALELITDLLQNSPDEGVLYLEKAKNHFALEQFSSAEESYTKALQKLSSETHKDLKIELLKVYQASQNYEKGLALASDLAKDDPHYYEVVANILMVMRQPREALKALDEYEAKLGYTESSEQLREVIYLDYKRYKEAISYYERKVKEDPSNVLWYAKLMRFYSQNNRLKKTIITGEEAMQINPFQPDIIAMLSLAYLAEGDLQKAIPFIENSLSHNEVSERNKVLIIQSFKSFVEENPSYQSELIRILDLAIASGESNASNEERGMFMRSRDKEKALESFQMALKDQPGKLSVIKEVIQLHLELTQFNEALQVSKKALEVYPTLSELFMLKATAEIGLNDFEEAIDTLEEGLDYLFDLPELEKKMYNLMALSFEGLEDFDKAKEYRERVEN